MRQTTETRAVDVSALIPLQAFVSLADLCFNDKDTAIPTIQNKFASIFTRILLTKLNSLHKLCIRRAVLNVLSILHEVTNTYPFLTLA